MDQSQRKVFYETPSAMVFERKFDIALRDTFDKPFRDRIARKCVSDNDRLILDQDFIPFDLNTVSTSTEHWPIVLKKLLSPTLTLDTDKVSLRGKIMRTWDIVKSAIKLQINFNLQPPRQEINH